MTTTEFTSLLKNPAQLNQMSYETLDKLLLQFPYCNSLRMLLLKKYKNDKHIAFERHLALASMYAADRSKLYDFLNTSVVSNTETKVVDIKASKPDEEKKTKLVTKLVDPPPIYHHKVSKNPPVLAFQPTLSVEDLSVGENKTDESKEEGDRSLSTMPIEEWLQDFEPPRIEEKGLPTKKGFKLSRIPIFEKGMFDFLETTEVAKASKTEKQKKRKKKAKESKAVLIDPISSTEELGATQDLKTESKESIFPEIEAVDQENEQEFEQLEQMYEQNAEAPDIFDLFLSQTDGFLKSLGDKKEGNKENTLEDWEDDSTTEDEEVASETLADLLALQGQKVKAIKMYETLSLKFPEKSRFFADKITELK
ncbi:hypothetical protein [Aureispira anguillae]|uniref:Uncharacterized protein n=1 Tax=Aureispira anguillae TaxID=2864201 RepID=A0A915YFZ6_9BACT|nr:hypothetical protein [Aureispira anguillae]BDS12434.1 hypothetical protein AsAng_0031550 [Aureispira anguillae]